MTMEPQFQGSPDPITVQPQPFDEGPKDPPGGCGRPVLVGCALAVVLTGLLMLVFLWQARDLLPALFRWSLQQLEQQVADNLPPDLSEAERRRLEEAFDAAAAAVEDGTADPAAMQRLQGRLLEVARAGRLSRRQVLDLAEALEEVAGQRAPPVDPEPLPEATEEPLPLTRRATPEQQRTPTVRGQLAA